MPTFNGARYIEKALASLEAVCDRIIVLDDGSTDETPDILRKHPIGPIYTNPPKQQDWARGGDGPNRNFLLRMADLLAPRHCVVLDDDEEFEDPEAVRECILQHDPEGLVFSLVHLWDREDMARQRAPATGTPIERPRAWKWQHGERVHLSARVVHCWATPYRRDPLVRHDLRIIHWGLFDAADRLKKYQRYRELDPNSYLNGENYGAMWFPIMVEPFVRKT